MGALTPQTNPATELDDELDEELDDELDDELDSLLELSELLDELSLLLELTLLELLELAVGGGLEEPPPPPPHAVRPPNRTSNSAICVWLMIFTYQIYFYMSRRLNETDYKVNMTCVDRDP